MSKIIMLLFCFSTIFLSCDEADDEPGLPSCLKDELDDFDNQFTCDDARVEQYMFQGKTVYLFETGTCISDGGSPVYSAGCNLLGVLGTIAGNITINGDDFRNAVFVRTIWEK